MHRSLLAYFVGYRQVTCYLQATEQFTPNQRELPVSLSSVAKIGGIHKIENKS